MADKTKDNETKKETGKSEYIASRTARVGSKKDGSAKISTKRGEKLSLTKDQADDYKRLKLID